MKGYCKTRLPFLLMLLASIAAFFRANASEPDYASIFGTNWHSAEQFVEINDDWMRKKTSENKVDFLLAKSIIFPELIRYSAIRDRMEITLLKALYVNYGPDYANFSVGVFQIKPSCAEDILCEVEKMNDRNFKACFKPLDRKLSIPEKREVLIKDLENPETEFMYVIALIKILEKKYHGFQQGNSEEWLRFYATAYNCGFTNTEEYIRNRVTTSSFHTGIIKSEIKYSYADISAAYYRIWHPADEN
jgi:hypothetical protein